MAWNSEIFIFSHYHRDIFILSPVPSTVCTILHPLFHSISLFSLRNQKNIKIRKQQKMRQKRVVECYHLRNIRSVKIIRKVCNIFLPPYHSWQVIRFLIVIVFQSKMKVYIKWEYKLSSKENKCFFLCSLLYQCFKHETTLDFASSVTLKLFNCFYHTLFQYISMTFAPSVFI